MNIVFLSKLTPESSYGGAEISAWYTAKGLVSLGHNVTLFPQVADLKNPELRSYTKDGVNVVEVPGLFGRNVLTYEKIWALRQVRILKKHLPEKINVVHSHDQHSSLINYSLKSVLKKRAIQHIQTVRDYAPICGYNHLKTTDEVCPKCSWENFKTCPKIVQGNVLQKPIRMQRFLKSLPYHQRVLAGLDKVVFITKFLQQEIIDSPNWRQSIPRPKSTTVIYNPVPNWQHFRKRNTDNKFRLLFVGRLEHHKGIGLLLQAMKIVNCADKDILLNVVGAGESNLYQEVAKKMGLDSIVQFKGRVLHKKMPQVYAQADLLIQPSIWPEPFGRGIIEALACGVPTLAADWGGPRELISDGVNGFLFRTNSKHDLAKRILEIKNRVTKIDLVLDRFNMDHIAKQYSDFYKK